MKRALALTLLAALILVSFGCGVEGSATKEPSASETPIVMPTPTPAPVPVQGGELYMYMPQNANIADPLVVTTEEMLYIFSLVFEGLVRLDDSGMPMPELASNWTVAADGKTWVFTLRSDVTWHSGYGNFSADDVIHTIDRLKSLGEDTYYAYNVSKIASYSAVDEGTVSITFTHEGISPVSLMTFPIVCKNASHISDKPIGTGGYLFSSVTDADMTLEINQKWWHTLPYIEKIHCLVRDNNITALASYSAGQLNFVATDVLYAGTYREAGVTSVMDVLTQDMETLLFNHSGICGNNNIRKAIAYAIDRQTIATNVYMHKIQLSDVPIAPDSYAYDSRSKAIEYNPEISKQLLANEGYVDVDDDGYLEATNSMAELTLNLLVNQNKESSVRRDAAVAIATYLEAIGIHVNVVTAEPVATDDAPSYLERLSSGDFDIALAGFALSRDIDLTQYVASGGSRNYGRYNGSLLAAAATELALAATQSEVRERAMEFMTLFTDELPFMVLYFRMNSIIYSTDIQGIPVGIREPDLLRTFSSWYMLSE